MEPGGEFERISGLFDKYLAGDFDKDSIRDELNSADESILEKLSRKYSCLDLGKFFRWGAIVPSSISGSREVRCYIGCNASVSFYLECCNKDVSLSDLHGEARGMYKEGESVNKSYNEISENRSEKEVFGRPTDDTYWWQRD